VHGPSRVQDIPLGMPAKFGSKQAALSTWQAALSNSLDERLSWLVTQTM